MDSLINLSWSLTRAALASSQVAHSRTHIVSAISLVFLAFSCGGVRRSPIPDAVQFPVVLFEETFGQPDFIQKGWSALLPEVVGATAHIEEGKARLALPSSGEIALVHPLDVASVRGKRLRVSARIWTDLPEQDAYVAVALGRSATDFAPRARTNSALATPTSFAFVIDVESDISRADLSLVLRGQGNAWFDAVKVEILGENPNPTRPITLSARQLNYLAALTRVVALVRYRHPSDQAATLDWSIFLPIAIDRVLRAESEDAFLATLQDLFAHIAPTIEFSRQPKHTLDGLASPAAGHLVRWRHIGLGPHEPFASWREGRDIDLASARVETVIGVPPRARGLKSQLHATVRGASNGGESYVYAIVDRGGDLTQRFDRKVALADTNIAIDLEIPIDAYQVRLGIELRGQAAITLEALSIAWTGSDETRIDETRTAWEEREATDLYSFEFRNCAAGRCLALARRPIDNTLVAERDILDMQILDRLWIHVPLAVWANDIRTLPETPAWVTPAPGTTSAAADRIATLASAWAALATFYPGFQDQKIDWLKELPGALSSGAVARDLRDTYLALSSLTAKLHDAHARAIHPAFPIDGMVPLAIRRFGDKLLVVGGLDDYIKFIPIGSEIIAIDHMPALRAYQELHRRVSSPTEGWETWAVPLWLTLGSQGSFSIFRVRTNNAKDTDLLLPRLSRELHSSLVREPRPRFGSDLAPGIQYVDLEDIQSVQWRGILDSLVRAQCIIMDMRGYPSNFAFTILGHFVDKQIRSPLWQTPILGSARYRTSYWAINPIQPRIPAKLVVLLDGRAASAAETFLQIVRDNHLAILVGETSAGTNGDPNTVTLPGGFTLRFTGVRVPFSNGGAVQGHGIIPDVIVHPTMQGVRAGRDEILEAAITLARRLIEK